MKKLKSKIVAIILITMLSLLIIPTNVFAATSKEIQTVKTTNGDYVIYVKDLIAGDGFRFAISDEEGKDPASIELNYINSVTDGNGNQVAFIESSTVAGKTETNLYIDDTETKIDLANALDVANIELVEGITNIIKTELKTNSEQRNIDGIKYTETVGGLEIADEDRESSTYEYVSVKLPADKYSDLQKLANELNEDNGSYESKDMYSKIEFVKEFIKLYEELINLASWQPVEEYLIKQPLEAQKGDEYVVLLKKTAQNGEITNDLKIMTSYREDEEEKIPGRTETKTVQETTKLPITGDNITLFAILAIIIIALIIVFTRMKNLQNKGNR